MKQLIKSKDYITVIKDNQLPERTLIQECNYSIDGKSLDGYRFEDGEKIIFNGNTIFRKGERIDIHKELDKNENLISLEEYHERKDSKGNLTYLKTIINDEVVGEEFYLYDKSNNETLRIERDHERHIFTAESFYDEFNRNTRFVLKTDDELFLFGECEYIKDRLVISKTFDAKKKVKDLDIEFLDKKGNPIYKAYYDNEGNYLSSVLSIYRTGKLMESVLYESNHEISEWINYKYDGNELLIEEKKKSYSKGELERTEIKEYEYEFFKKKKNKMTKLSKNIINESSLNKAYQYSIKHDTGFINASRGNLTRKINKSRNKALEASLASKGYGITSVKGSYIENYEKKDAREVGEITFFVVDYRDRGNLKSNLVALGEKFNQDSVLFVKKGGEEAELVGTNDSKSPGRGKIEKRKNIVYGKSGKIMTRVNGRPFIFKESIIKDDIKHSCNIMGQWGAHAVARDIFRELNMDVD
jgi:hypothetical protein